MRQTVAFRMVFPAFPVLQTDTVLALHQQHAIVCPIAIETLSDFAAPDGYTDPMGRRSSTIVTFVVSV